MPEIVNLTTHRRGFLGRIAAGAAALGLGGWVTPPDAVAQPRAASRDVSANPEFEAWLNKITGKHKMMYDVPEPNEGFAFAWARVFLNTTNETYGTTDGDNSVVIVLRHSGIPYAMESAMWAKYKLGEGFKIADPATKGPAVRHPLLRLKPAAPLRRRSNGWLSPAARLGQEPQDLQVQPDQRDHQTERAVPLHVLGRAAGHTGLDEVEVEDQVQRRDDDDHTAHHDTGGAVPLEERHGDVEQRDDPADDVVQDDRTGRRDHAELELLGRLDQPGAVGHEHRGEGREGQTHRLHHDAWVLDLEQRGKPAEREPFERGVYRRREGRPFLLPDRCDGHDEPADRPEQDPGGRHRGVERRADLAPDPGRGHDHQKEK